MAGRKKTIRVEFSQGMATRLLGQIAVAKSLITEKQLKDVLKEQEDLGRRGRPVLLGRLLLEKKLVTEFELESLLRTQSELNRQREMCATAQVSIGDLCVAGGDYAGAVKAYEAVLARYKDCGKACATALHKIGDCYKHMGRPDRAREAYQGTIDTYHVD